MCVYVCMYIYVAGKHGGKKFGKFTLTKVSKEDFEESIDPAREYYITRMIKN